MAIVCANNVTVTLGGVEISAFNCQIPIKKNVVCSSEIAFTPKILIGNSSAMTAAEKRKFDDFINELESK
jgi:hypothetical protein